MGASLNFETPSLYLSISNTYYIAHIKSDYPLDQEGHTEATSVRGGVTLDAIFWQLLKNNSYEQKQTRIFEGIGIRANKYLVGMTPMVGIKFSGINESYRSAGFYDVVSGK